MYICVEEIVASILDCAAGYGEWGGVRNSYTLRIQGNLSHSTYKYIPNIAEAASLKPKITFIDTGTKRFVIYHHALLTAQIKYDRILHYFEFQRKWYKTVVSRLNADYYSNILDTRRETV